MHSSTSQFDSRALLAGALVLLASCGGGGGGGGGSVAPPSNLAYAREIALYANGLAAPVNAASVTGVVTSWDVTPALPAGLALDPLTGAIAGTPSGLAVAQDHVVRASNSAGFVEATVRVAVVRPAHMVVAIDTLDDAFSSFVVDASTGALTPTGYTLPSGGALAAHAIVAHPDLDTAYVSLTDSNHLGVFDIDRASGRVHSRINVSTQANKPEELVLHPGGGVLYAFSRQSPHVESFSVDPLTGDLTSIGALAVGTAGAPLAAVSPDGRFVWLSKNHALTTLSLDPGTLLPSIVGAPLAVPGVYVALAVTPDGRRLVAATLGSGSKDAVVDVYDIDAQTGALTSLQSLDTGLFPGGLALDPTGRFAYLSISSDDTIRSYSFDATGTLTEIATTPTGDRPIALRLDETGEHLYVTESNDAQVGVYSVDPVSGALTRLESMRTRELPLALVAIGAESAAQPRTRFAYVGNSASNDVTVYTAAPASGALTVVEAGLPFGGRPGSIARHPDGAWVYAADATNHTVRAFSVDPLSAQLTPIGVAVGVGTTPVAAQVDPSGRFLYVANNGSDDVSLLSIHPTTGALTFVAGYATGTAPVALAIDPSGRFVMTANAMTASLTDGTVTSFEAALADGTLMAALAPVALGDDPSALAAHPSGRYLLTTFTNSGRLGLFSLAAADGSLAFITSKPCGVDPAAVAVHPGGAWIYVANFDSAGVGDVSYCRLDTSTDLLTRISDANAGDHPSAIVIDPSGQFLYVVNKGSDDVARMTIDPVSGAPLLVEASAAGDAPDRIAIVPSYD